MAGVKLVLVCVGAMRVVTVCDDLSPLRPPQPTLTSVLVFVFFLTLTFVLLRLPATPCGEL